MQNTEEKLLEYDFTIDEIETNLRLLNDLKENEKLIISDQYIMVDNRYFSSFRRWFTNDDREIIIKFINLIVLDAKKYYKEMIQKVKNGEESKENYNRLSTFTNLIQGSRDGLSNLSKTYEGDKLLKAKIETIKREVNYLVSEFISTGREYY